MDKIKLTQESYSKLEEEFETLVNSERPRIAKLLKEAIEQGDLSENDAYTQAKDLKAHLEMKIREIKQTLNNAEIVQGGQKNKVGVGSNIKIKNSDGRERSFVIVNAANADPSNGKLSYDSPLGQAFMGKKPKDKIKVELPSGVKEYTILDIT